MIYTQSFTNRCFLALVTFPYVLEDLDNAIDKQDHNRVRQVFEEFMDSIEFKERLVCSEIEIHNSKVDMYMEIQGLYNEFMEQYNKYLETK